MDSLTHTVLGACIGQALAGKKIGKKAMLWGAIANNLPDIDVITSLWMTQADGLLAHRGFTHSILFALLVSPLLAYWLHRKYKETTMTYNNWLVIFLSGNLIHIIIDSFTCYGTGWFEPFSHYRVSFDLIFVADPFFTIAILISSLALLFMKKNNPNRNKWAKGALIICGLYLVLACYDKFIISKNTEEQLALQKLPVSEFIATPTPLNNFLWYIMAKSDSGFYVTYQSVFDKDKKLDFQFHPQNKQLLDSIPVDAEFEKLIRFSKGYYVIDKIQDTTYLCDIRFGQMGGWYIENAKFVFRYSLNKNANNDLVIQRGRFEGSMKEAVGSLYDRILDKQ